MSSTTKVRAVIAIIGDLYASEGYFLRVTRTGIEV